MDQDNQNQPTVDEAQQQAGQADGHVGQTEPATDMSPTSGQEVTGGEQGDDTGDDEDSPEDEI